MPNKTWMTPVQAPGISAHNLFQADDMSGVSGKIDVTRRQVVSVMIDPNNPKIPNIEGTLFGRRTHDSILVATTDLQKSKNWDKYANMQPTNHGGGLFNEGFPKSSHLDDKIFEIITSDGQRHKAYVDFSTQHRDEGIQWRVISSDTLRRRESVDKYHVMAWQEIEE